MSGNYLPNITPSELRLGNFIYIDDGQNEPGILKVTEGVMREPYPDPRKLLFWEWMYPLEMSGTKILEKSFFIKLPDNFLGISAPVYWKRGLFIDTTDGGYLPFLITDRNFIPGTTPEKLATPCILRRIRYVHELQNLYAILMGRDLSLDFDEYSTIK